MTVTSTNIIPGHAPQYDGTSPPRPPHGLTVLGWVVAALSSVPMIIGSPGHGPAPFLVAGIAAFGAGVVMIIVGKRLHGPDQG